MGWENQGTIRQVEEEDPILCTSKKGLWGDMLGMGGYTLVRFLIGLDKVDGTSIGSSPTCVWFGS